MRQRSLHTNFRGYTLVETLVCIGVLSVVIGLTLPAVFAARQASRKAHCAWNLKQLALSVQTYETAFGSFPNSAQCGYQNGLSGSHCYSLQCALLPFLEQQSLYSNINFNLPGTNLQTLDGGNLTASKTRLNVLLCPSDTNPLMSDTACTNYRANLGLCQLCGEDNSGPFWHSAAQGASSVVDGLSNTISFSEKPVGSNGQTANSRFRDWRELVLNFQVSSSREWLELCSSSDSNGSVHLDAGKSWLFPGGIYTTFYVSAPPNSAVPDCGTSHANGVGVFAARSFHATGVNAGFCDGSVRFFSSTTSGPVWRAPGTRRGGEIVPAF